jgi:hypothetical protein
MILLSGVMSNDPLKPRPDRQRFFWGFLAGRHRGALDAMRDNYKESSREGLS